MTTADELLGYDGKRVLVVGGATGMGAAAAQIAKSLGSHVTVMDYAPVDYAVDRVISLDLSDQDSIDRAIDELDGPVDSVFSAAGIADGPKLMRVNFIGHRHLIERLFAGNLLNRGAAICFISSVAGMGWENSLERVQDFLAAPDYKSACDWVHEHEAEGFIHYGFSKQAINAYVAWQGYHFLKKGVRINAVCPGPTDTPLARANADLWLTFAQDYRDDTGSSVLTPEEIGKAMILLNSAAAGAVNGITLNVDNGHAMASLTGSFAPGKPIMDLITGRVQLA
ncbi:SDR family oxidoreductase [Mycobacterium lacus]|uniref:3-hydroxyacyl-CoA dehydrogenase n=1 Tax=Mycobacterium lacus TaxID=169765 RepID=A0A1X1Y261_9MYCO|nr:SDR family oxidoreductase [Mycobacterium lacus]MCV7124717.1 SDR family oxidoreductase [Mycobacterium lacus]ORW05084.1 short-chain dehydrogenase [Mycobacterium lacus]BBX95261.1 3-hydroxyacyl-CoA dehydrogenase [Mycobacterium lacus]